MPSEDIHDVAQPAPAFLHVAGRGDDLEDSLRPSFLIDEGAIGFGKGSRGQHGMRGLSRRIVQAIQRDDVLPTTKEFPRFVAGKPSEQIVFQHDDRF